MANDGAGSRGNYLLTATVVDTQSPVVTGLENVPQPGQTVDEIPSAIRVYVSEDLDPASLADAFILRAAGDDGDFGTADDVIYDTHQLPTYLRGDYVELKGLNGQLVPGPHRLTVTGAVTDVTGNTLDGNGDGIGGDPFVREFSLRLPGDYPRVLETDDNDAREDATALGLIEDPNVPAIARAVGLWLGRSVG